MGGWIVEMEDILHLSGEECFVCAFLGLILGADKAYQRQNLKILITVLNVKCVGWFLNFAALWVGSSPHNCDKSAARAAGTFDASVPH